MKIENGIDIIEVNRIKNDIETLGSKFLSRIYTENEIMYCESKKSQKYQSYAARFAAKEAIYKATSSHINCEYTWKDFEILNDEKGKPYAKLGITIDELDELTVSLSHSKEYAVANVIAVYK